MIQKDSTTFVTVSNLNGSKNIWKKLKGKQKYKKIKGNDEKINY